MKRYLVFSGSQYYPRGGWDDFDGSFDTIKEARDVHPPDDYTWRHIVDTETGEKITSDQVDE